MTMRALLHVNLIARMRNYINANVDRHINVNSRSNIDFVTGANARIHMSTQARFGIHAITTIVSHTRGRIST